MRIMILSRPRNSSNGACRLLLVFSMGLLLATCVPGCSRKPAPQVPADWDSQLAVAQQEARRMHPDVVLEDVSTDLTPFRVSDDIPPMYVTFTFINTSGNAVHVTIEQTQPVRVFHSYESHRGHPAIPSADELEQLEAIGETIQLTAADAMTQTMNERLFQDFAQIQEQVVVSTRLFIETSKEAQETGYPPAYWYVKYSNNQGAEEQFMTFYLDARTGEVLGIVLSESLSDLYPNPSEVEE